MVTTDERPETTTIPGPFTAAIEMSVGCSCTTAATVASDANTAAIVPSRGTLSISFARAAMSFRPSSRLKIPAMHAATYSPRLWPATASGLTPQDNHNFASANSKAKRAGCVYCVSLISAPSLDEYSTDIRSTGSSGFRIFAHASMLLRNTGCVS